MNFERQRLEDSSVLPQNIYYSELRTDIHLRLHVRNYSKLKNKVIYYASYGIYGYTWTYKLVIANGILFAFVYTTTKLERPAFYIYKAKMGYVINNFCKRYENMILSEFCNRAIMDPTNGYLHHDNLYIKFKYEMEEPLKYNYVTKYGTMESVLDGVELCKNLKCMYLAALNADVKILVQDEVTFWVHKAILAVSSKAFAEYFQMNQPPCNKITCIYLDEKPKIFHIALIFIYSGEINFLVQNDIISVYDMAIRLQFDTLKEKCFSYSEEKFGPSNVFASMNEARLRDLEEVSNAGKQSKIIKCSDLSSTPK